jgi:mono/diheme cytochrome c family protein
MVRIKKYIVFAFLILILGSCFNDRNHPGYEYFPDMALSTSPGVYENTLTIDSISLREPPLMSIPNKSRPYELKKNADERFLAGQVIHMPENQRNNLTERGKELYNRICIHCHGETGNADGILHTSGKFAYPPARLNIEKVQNLPDGEIFHVISVGHNLMQPLGEALTPTDRWEIVKYIKTAF